MKATRQSVCPRLSDAIGSYWKKCHPNGSHEVVNVNRDGSYVSIDGKMEKLPKYQMAESDTLKLGMGFWRTYFEEVKNIHENCYPKELETFRYWIEEHDYDLVIDILNVNYRKAHTKTLYKHSIKKNMSGLDIDEEDFSAHEESKLKGKIRNLNTYDMVRSPIHFTQGHSLPFK